jgi:glycosyltransferase involved in cell wall biosynthesis
LAHGSVLMRKDGLAKIGFYDENIRYAQDYDLFARLAKNFKLANLPDHLYFWRNHKKNISNDKREKQQVFVKMIRDKMIFESENKVSPDFSILMANFNQGKYLDEAIKSVLAQSFQNWELVIIDDCSTDNSVKVIEKYLGDKRIRFFKNEKNLGYIQTLKKLIENSHAPIVGILDGDDALSSTAIEEILDYYKKNYGANFVYSQFMFCDPKLQPVKKGFARRIPPGQTNLQADCVSAFRTFTKNCYFRTAGFDQKMIYAEDQDLYFKMEEITDLFFLDKVLYYYRVLPTSQSHDFRKAKIGRISHILARYYAYRRRRNLDIVNLKRRQIARELLTALRVCVQARDIKRGFLISWYLLREFFHL